MTVGFTWRLSSRSRSLTSTNQVHRSVVMHHTCMCCAVCLVVPHATTISHSTLNSTTVLTGKRSQPRTAVAELEIGGGKRGGSEAKRTEGQGLKAPPHQLGVGDGERCKLPSGTRAKPRSSIIRMIELRPVTFRLDFWTDQDSGLEPGWIFPFLQRGEIRYGVFRH